MSSNGQGNQNLHPKMVDTTEYQIGQKGVVVLVWNKESSIWKESSMKALIRRAQLKYIEVGEMRVVPNNKRVAEQINGDKIKRTSRRIVSILKNLENW